MHHRAARTVHPLPRSRGRDREGACNKIERDLQKVHMRTLTPSPPLPRKRGREQTEFAGRAEVQHIDLRFFSRHRLDQHGAALAAADAFGGDALLDAAALHGVDEMQHDAVAARAYGMAEADCTSVDV